MKSASEKNNRRLRRIARVRAKVHGTTERPRLSVYRSLAHVSAQIIDDVHGTTLVLAHDSDISDAERKGKKKTELAALVGKLVAERAKAKGISEVVFDRRDKRYHGRLRALAEGAREGGLKF
ncbi:MAG TPA: 50S ribosomal protein L18 [Patescibacteria group bacterium]|nr:50S ribosomal protein L18 [Patescibacteria group bacterium]